MAKNINKGIRPNHLITERISDGTYPLHMNCLFSKHAKNMGLEEFIFVSEEFNKKIDINNFPNGINAKNLQSFLLKKLIKIIQAEQQYRKELEQLAIDIIREIFQVPDSVNLIANICDAGSIQLPDELAYEQISLERKMELENEIQKRIILNAFVHGSAFHIWRSLHHIVKEKIDTINKNLITDYDEYGVAMHLYMWLIPIPERENLDFLQGLESIEFEKNEVKIKAEGLIFPLLIHELTKGVFDYIICKGIPQELTSEELKYVYERADDYNYEFWYYILSPTLWRKFIKAVDVFPEELPKKVSKMSQMNYEELCQLCDRIMTGKEIKL